jgi:hypothetical protein
MFTQSTTSLGQRRKDVMDSVLMKATQDVAQKVTDGLISGDDARKVHVYAIAALASGIPGADNTAGSADRRRATVEEYLDGLLSEAESDAA